MSCLLFLLFLFCNYSGQWCTWSNDNTSKNTIFHSVYTVRRKYNICVQVLKLILLVLEIISVPYIDLEITYTLRLLIYIFIIVVLYNTYTKHLETYTSWEKKLVLQVILKLKLLRIALVVNFLSKNYHSVSIKIT